ncbi:FapA family protein, partial [Pseudoalteromonas sp. 41-MNA-CIBAN-0057]
DEPFTCSIFAKRTVALGYSQYCDIKTEQNLLIERQSLHCDLSAGNLIRVGSAKDPKGKIIGGHILDAMRIETGELGAPAGTKTRVCIAQRWYVL